MGEEAAAEAARIASEAAVATKSAKIAAKEIAAAEAARLAAEESERAASEDAARKAAEETGVEAAQNASTIEATAETASNSDKGRKEQEPTKDSAETQEKSTGGEKVEHFHLYIHKSRNLENKDILGKSDPYVHVRCGSNEARSPTVDNNLNPEWQFHTKLSTDETSPKSIEIKIFDDDFGKSDPLGKLTLDLESFKKGKQIEHEWLPLEGAVTGEVQVS